MRFCVTFTVPGFPEIQMGRLKWTINCLLMGIGAKDIDWEQWNER